MNHRLVVVDDDPVTLKRLRRILESDGFRVSTYSNGQRLLDHLDTEPCDLVISDVKMPGMNGMDLMVKARQRRPDLPFILITGFATLDGAISATREGAFYYLPKPFTPDELRRVVGGALTSSCLHDPEGEDARIEAPGSAPVVIGKSAKIRQVVSLARQIAPSDCNVLITGDSGTGKELIARTIHAWSPRAEGPFLAFNCGALTESLMENELFGHEKGAFTGAVSCSPGLLESAEGGTLFLDEIGEMPVSMQVKLLRVLQEREVIRVGGRQPRPIDVRIVSATSKDLQAAVAEGTFRKDFYFRVHVVDIHVPPLRERAEDIPLLARHILGRIGRQAGKSVTAISPMAMNLLARYPFPGNVRELENLLERAVAITEGNCIGAADLPPDLAELELQAYKLPDGPLPTLEDLEQDYIAHVLKLTNGVRTRAAEILGIDRASLWRKIKKFGLD